MNMAELPLMLVEERDEPRRRGMHKPFLQIRQGVLRPVAPVVSGRRGGHDHSAWFGARSPHPVDRVIVGVLDGEGRPHHLAGLE